MASFQSLKELVMAHCLNYRCVSVAWVPCQYMCASENYFSSIDKVIKEQLNIVTLIILVILKNIIDGQLGYVTIPCLNSNGGVFFWWMSGKWKVFDKGWLKKQLTYLYNYMYTSICTFKKIQRAIIVLKIMTVILVQQWAWP